MRSLPFSIAVTGSPPCRMDRRGIPCPIKGAISIETVFAPDGSKRKSPVVHEPCVGCGVCEMVCPVEPTCITIEAREVWKT